MMIGDLLESTCMSKWQALFCVYIFFCSSKETKTGLVYELNKY